MVSRFANRVRCARCEGKREKREDQVGFAKEGFILTKGFVKWFDTKKGYGFIEQPGGDDVFVHYSGIEGDGFRSLRAGEEVEFEVSQGPKGPQATRVVRAS